MKSKKFIHVAMLGALLATSVILGLQVARAFKPNNEDHGHRRITKQVLTTGYDYQNTSVPGYSTTLSSGQVVKFTEQAAEDVVTGNRSTDAVAFETVTVNGVVFFAEAELDNPAAHCDDELVALCSDRIVKLRDEVIAHLKAYALASDEQRSACPFGYCPMKVALGQARIKFGKALHTIQDFYAHSNYSDSRDNGTTYGMLTTGISKDYFASRIGNECMPVNNGGNFELVKSSSGQDAVYTTGFFSKAGAAGSDKEGAARCDHGLGPINGINKDSMVGPTEGPHVHASYLAALHTREFTAQVVALINTAAGVTNEQRDFMIASLMGIDLEVPLIGFVVDTTGSMGPIIDGVKTQIQKIINDSVGTADSATKKFLILDYGDPDVGTAFIGNATQVKDRANGLYPAGGEDCPELTNTGLKRALEAAPGKSSLYVFTDASSKDGSLAAEVKALAQNKKIAVTYLVTGSCSPIDPTYYEISAASGGQVLLADHTSSGVAAAFTGISIEASGVVMRPVHLESGTFSGTKEITVPVEAGAARLSILATSDLGTISFYTPAGTLVTETQQITDFLGGKGLRVANPATGLWKVVYTSLASTAYSNKADVAGSIDYASLVFTSTEASGRVGHEAYMPYQGMPPIGPVRLEATVKGGIVNPVFDAIAEDGRTLGSGTMSRFAGDLWVGSASIGTEPFRMRVRGTDAVGAAVSRVLPTLYSGKNFELKFVDVPKLTLGLPNKLYLSVRNAGGAGDVDISAATGMGTVISTIPATVSLPVGSTTVVEIVVALPSATSTADIPQLTVVASSSGVTETLTVGYSVFADQDGDGIPDELEMGPAGSNPTYDGNGDGIADRTQANVLSLYSRSKNAYISMWIDGPGRFELASAARTPAETGTNTFPFDLFDFKIVGMTPGASTQVRMRLPDAVQASGYAKYGPLSTAATAVWYDFAYDGTTGARFSGNVVTLYFVDGRRGDDDLAANGEIIDIGGPSGIVYSGVVTGGGDIPVESGGGGGCTIGRPGQPGDHSLPVLVMLAAGVIWYRRRRVKIQ